MLVGSFPYGQYTFLDSFSLTISPTSSFEFWCDCQVFPTFFHHVFYAESDGHCLYSYRKAKDCAGIYCLSTMQSGTKKMTKTSKMHRTV
jgi:hypothetical protein